MRIVAVPCAMPQMPSARCSLTWPAPTSTDWTSSRIIQPMNTTPCRCTIGGAGGKLPWRAGTKDCIPKPPKTKNAIASVIQKKNDGLKRRTGSSAAAAGAGVVMARPAPWRYGRLAITFGEKDSTAVALFESVCELIDYIDLRNRNKSLFCTASMLIWARNSWLSRALHRRHFVHGYHRQHDQAIQGDRVPGRQAVLRRDRAGPRRQVGGVLLLSGRLHLRLPDRAGGPGRALRAAAEARRRGLRGVDRYAFQPQGLARHLGEDRQAAVRLPRRPEPRSGQQLRRASRRRGPRRPGDLRGRSRRRGPDHGDQD